jgi:hypothetical protein
MKNDDCHDPGCRRVKIVVLGPIPIAGEFVRIVDSKGSFAVFMPRNGELPPVFQHNVIRFVAHFAEIACRNGFFVVLVCG